MASQEEEEERGDGTFEILKRFRPSGKSLFVFNGKFSHVLRNTTYFVRGEDEFLNTPHYETDLVLLEADRQRELHRIRHYLTKLPLHPYLSKILYAEFSHYENRLVMSWEGSSTSFISLENFTKHRLRYASKASLIRNLEGLLSALSYLHSAGILFGRIMAERVKVRDLGKDAYQFVLRDAFHHVVKSGEVNPIMYEQLDSVTATEKFFMTFERPENWDDRDFDIRTIYSPPEDLDTITREEPLIYSTYDVFGVAVLIAQCLMWKHHMNQMVDINHARADILGFIYNSQSYGANFNLMACMFHDNVVGTYEEVIDWHIQTLQVQNYLPLNKLVRMRLEVIQIANDIYLTKENHTYFNILSDPEYSQYLVMFMNEYEAICSQDAIPALQQFKGRVLPLISRIDELKTEIKNVLERANRSWTKFSDTSNSEEDRERFKGDVQYWFDQLKPLNNQRILLFEEYKEVVDFIYTFGVNDEHVEAAYYAVMIRLTGFDPEEEFEPSYRMFTRWFSNFKKGLQLLTREYAGREIIGVPIHQLTQNLVEVFHGMFMVDPKRRFSALKALETLRQKPQQSPGLFAPRHAVGRKTRWRQVYSPKE